MRRAHGERQVSCGLHQAPRCAPSIRSSSSILAACGRSVSTATTAWETSPRTRPSAQRDPLIGMYFHRIPLGPPFSVEWSGHLYAPTTGRYHLGTRQHDTARVYVDGRPVFSNTKPDELLLAPIRLARGWHRVRIRYRAHGWFPGLPLLDAAAPAHVHRPVGLSPPYTQSPEFALLPTLADTTGELRPGRLREADG